MRKPVLAVVALLSFAAPAAAAPQVTITKGPPDLTNSEAAVFDFTVSENGSTTCQLDALDPAPCTSPVSYDVAEGAHVFRVKAGASEAARQWTVDTTPPETAITQAPQSGSDSPAPEFTFASEPGATFRCELNVPGPFACASGPMGPISPGNNKLLVVAIDAAGNADPSAAVHGWFADFSPPGPPLVRIAWNGSKSFSSIPPSPLVPSSASAASDSQLPKVMLKPSPRLAWQAPEAGATTSLRLEQRRELRVLEGSFCTSTCFSRLPWVYSDAVKFTEPKSLPDGQSPDPAKVQPPANVVNASPLTVARGRTFCYAGIARDGWGRPTADTAPFSCIAHPNAMTWNKVKPVGVKVVRDSGSWSGSKITLKPAQKSLRDVRTGIRPRIDVDLGAFTADRHEATWVPWFGLVGPTCQDCGAVAVRLSTATATIGATGITFKKGPDIVRTLRFDKPKSAARARFIQLSAGAWVTKATIVLKGSTPQELSGIAIPYQGGGWDVPCALPHCGG